jgi:hypothetical protein
MIGPMFELLILSLLLVLLVLSLGLPLLLSPDSRAPVMISFCILTAFVAAIIWSTGAWWILLPIAALIFWAVRLDGRDRETPVGDLDRRGRSAPTRLRLRLWGAASLAVPALFAALFFVPFGSAVTFVVPGMAIAMAAMTLFRYSFYRSALRDYEAGPGPETTATPAALG